VAFSDEEKKAAARMAGAPSEALKQEATAFLAAYDVAGQTRLLG